MVLTFIFVLLFRKLCVNEEREIVTELNDNEKMGERGDKTFNEALLD